MSVDDEGNLQLSPMTDMSVRSLSTIEEDHERERVHQQAINTMCLSQHVDFPQRFSDAIIAMGDSVTGIATTHKAYLDSLSANDYQHMGISATVLKDQVRYSDISELNVKYLATQQKKENHRRRLVQAWGTDWRHSH